MSGVASSTDAELRRGPSAPPTWIGPTIADHWTGPGGNIVETTELRWFAHGPLPTPVWMWFTDDGASGAVERRSDLYRVDGRADIGVKLRARSTLEFKVRRSVSSPPRSTGLAGGPKSPPGVIEVWQKWGPADEGAVGVPEPDLEVRKTVVKRRFAADGGEIPLLERCDPTVSAFCDVEVVAIGGVADAWSLAFAAQGPRPERRASIDAAWRTLISAAAPPAWPPVFAASCGYPEWLAEHIMTGAPRFDSTSGCPGKR